MRPTADESVNHLCRINFLVFFGFVICDKLLNSYTWICGCIAIIVSSTIYCLISTVVFRSRLFSSSSVSSPSRNCWNQRGSKRSFIISSVISPTASAVLDFSLNCYQKCEQLLFFQVKVFKH